MQCDFAKICSGCSQWETPYLQQKQAKIEKLFRAFPEYPKDEIEFKSFGEFGLRSRMDFVLDQDRFGLYSHLTQRIEDLPDCLQLSPELQNFYTKFRSVPFPKLKGSFRLRVSPKNKLGAWLDFSNLDIQTLLKNSPVIQSLTSLATLEMGQKHKIVAPKENNKWGLSEPNFQEWTESLYKNQFVPLVSTVASFTQPSHIANQWIVTQISRIVSKIRPQKILEFGSGFGNLTFPCLYDDSVQMTCLEMDTVSSEALKRNVRLIKVENQVSIQTGDFRKKHKMNREYDFVLVNPARNGIGQLFKSFDESTSLPKTVLYMSCYPETLVLDSQNLKNLGYKLTLIKIADQFPQTHHMEVISLWEK